MKRDRLLAYAAFAIVCIVWGTTYLAIRVAIESLPTLLFAGARFAIAGAILLAFCALRGEKIPRRLADWGNVSIVGILMIGVANVAVVWAEQYVPSGLAALLVATSPFWMSILEYFRKSEQRLSTRKKIGMLVGFSGVALLVSPALHPTGINLHFLLGVIVLQIGSIAWNLGSVRSKYYVIEASPMLTAAMQMLTGGIFVAILGLGHGELSLFTFTTRTLIAFLYLIFFGSILAYAAYVYALSKLPTSTVSLYAYVNPAVAVVLGWLILNEPLGWRAVASMAVILLGVAIVQTAGRGAGSPKQSTLAVVPPLPAEVPASQPFESLTSRSTPEPPRRNMQSP